MREIRPLPLVFIQFYFFTDDVKSLSLPGSYHQKISHLGNSLRGFTRLKHLDLSRNDISVVDVRVYVCPL